MSGRSPAWFRCLAPLALVVVLSGGCGGTARPNSGAGTPADGPALRALRSLADRPPSRSDRGTLIAPAPPGLESLAPPDPTPNDDATAAARRSRPLRELLPELSEPDRPPPEPDRIATPSERLGALRRYAAGREKLLRGDAPGALSDLRAAADLDPSSGEVWLALGDAQSLSGAKAESLAATERAVRLGAGGARPWEVLGREALANGDNARAAAMLSRAAGIPSGRRGSDPALQSLIGIELGQALDGLGYARAAIESLGASLRLLDSVQGTQRYRAELAAITRRKGGLWVRVGDLACRAGDFARARDAYQKAALLPAFGPGSERLLDRRVFAALRTGRPGEAALVVYEAVAASGGWAGEPDVALGAYLRSHGGREAPATLDGAFEALSRSPAPASSPALRGRLALIRAALLPARQASRVLQSQLLGLPADDRAATSLLWLAHSQSVEAAARQAVSLTARSPLRAETYARTLISLASLDQLLKSLEKAPANPARDLLSGRLLALVEAIDESLVRLDRASLAAAPGSVLRMGVELASAEVAGSAGRWDRVERSLAALQADWPDVDEASLLWARAGALSAAQRFAPTAAILRRLADAPAQFTPPAARIEHLMAAAELAARSGQSVDAERWLLVAQGIDPWDERVHARLIGVYAPSGGRPDQTKLGEAIRRLRQACPEGRVVRVLRAQDMLRRAPADDTLGQVLSLVRDDPAEGAPLEMLAEAAARLPADAPARPEVEAILLDRLARAPDDAAVVLALARVLADSGRMEQAEQTLRNSLRARPRTDAARALERLIRQAPARAGEADQLALARLGGLAGSPPGARSISGAIELAELFRRLGRVQDAAAALASGIPDGATLTSLQAAVVLDIAAKATSTGGNVPNPAALVIMQLAADHGVRLPEELQGRRLVLLLSDPATTAEQLHSAARRMASDYPDLGVVPYLFVARNLSAAEAGAAGPTPLPRGRALAFAELAAADRPDPELLAEWLSRVGVFGDVADARRMIESALSAGVEGEVIRQISPPADTPGIPAPPPATGASGAAELAQIGGDIASVQGRDDIAAEFYRLSLSYDPAQPWAANNLGYHLAETARDADGSINLKALAESERLLNIAVAALPEDGSVLDSLGWVRYRRGLMRDQTDEQGLIVAEGAITLLSRAARSSKGEDNHTILDHLGDALWMAGEKDTAAGAWALAEQAARQRLDALRSASVPRRTLEEVSEALGRVASKLAAVRTGMTPAVGWTLPSPE